jgi:uncharacterized protein (TIGR02284 family)
MAADSIRVLNDLISTLRDSGEGFDKAAKGVHTGDLRQTFDTISLKREAFAEELAAAVTRLGGQPARIGHDGGPLSRGWSDLEARIRPRQDAEFLAACQRGEETTLRHYDHARTQDLPADLRDIIEGQFRSIRDTIEQLRRMEKANRAA